MYIPKILSCLTLILVTFSAIAFAKPSSRIYNGKDATIGQFPYQVAIFFKGDFWCGGSIVSSRYVLTAAHCVMNEGVETYPAEMFTLRAGSIQRMAGGTILKVKNVIVRSSYNYQKFLDDIALLELKNDIVFTENMNKIDLFDGEVPMGEPVVISGWGKIETTFENPQRLQYTTLKALDTRTCGKEIGMGYKQILCLAHENDNGICAGDSGGPAIYKDKLVGVVAFNHKGCGGVEPDGFSKISYHLEWILKNMKS